MYDRKSQPDEVEDKEGVWNEKPIIGVGGGTLFGDILH